MGIVWALCAALTVTTSETLFARSVYYTDRLWCFIPLAIAANYFIFQLVKSVPTLLDALIIFSLAACLLRIGSTVWILQQPVRSGTWAGIALIITANLLRIQWK